MKDFKICKKIGILGGTFNPIHNGHLMVAECAYKELELDVVLLMPSGISYLKAGTNVLPGELRFHMAELCAQGKEYLQASDIEILRQGNTYTYETLEYMKREYPLTEFYFIVGADSLLSMDRWVEPGRIFKSCIVVAVGRGTSTKEVLRNKQRELEERFCANVYLLDFSHVDISSSEIRRRIREGKNICHMVPQAINEYIMENNLYKD